MSKLTVTTIETANTTTDLTIRTGNTSGPAIVLQANGGTQLQNVSSLSVGNSSSNVVISGNTVAINGQNLSPVASFKNKIINGNFDIHQRSVHMGESNTTSNYFVDRWVSSHTGTTKTVSRQAFTLGQTDVPGEPAYFIRHVVTSSAGAANHCNFTQHIESVRTLAGKNATVSFWAKADSTKQIAIAIYQSFGTGGSPSSTVWTPGQKITLTTSWQKFSLTFAIPSISGKTIGSNNNDLLSINFFFDAGSNWNSYTDTLGQQSGTFDIAQVQVEEGNVATPFEQRPIGLELSFCQRYYELCQGSVYGGVMSVSGHYLAANWVFKVQKRALPTRYYHSGSAGTELTYSPDLMALYGTAIDNWSVISYWSWADAEL